MGHWALVRFAVMVRPAGSGRGWIWSHIDRCPACRARLASREEARRLLVQAGDVGRLDGIWPAVLKSVGAVSPNPGGTVTIRSARRAGDRLWRWGAALTGIGCAAVLIMIIVRSLLPTGDILSSSTGSAGEMLRIHYARINGRPAETFIIDVPEDDMVVVWVEIDRVKERSHEKNILRGVDRRSDS
jgi:hypothetical protein